MARMNSYENYWSDQARQEFNGLFEGDPAAEPLRQSVAEALVRGWSGNKDKPFWALCALTMAAAEAARHSHGDAPDALDIIGADPSETWAQLRRLAEETAADDKVSQVRLNERGSLEIAAGDTAFVLTAARLRILKKLAEFLLIADDFAYAGEFMDRAGQLVAAQPGDTATLKDNARAFARLAYAYRQKHFVDTSTTSSFGLIYQFVRQELGYQVDDDSVLRFWSWPDNGRYSTYQAAFFAFADFHESLRDVTERRAFSSAVSIHDEDAGWSDLVDPSAAPDAWMDGTTDEEDDLLNSEEDGVALADINAPDAISDGSLKLLKEKELRLLRHLSDLKPFGREHPLASLRLIGFHPVQSGISNSLRTGRSKLTLEERLTCVEAHTYDEIDMNIAALDARLAGYLKAALAARMAASGIGADEVNDPRTAELLREGVTVLSKVRERKAKADAGSSGEGRKAAWAEIEPALLVAQSVTRVFGDAIARRFAGDDATRSEHLMRAFGEDRAIFQQRFTERYGQTSGTAEAVAASRPDQTGPSEDAS